MCFAIGLQMLLFFFLFFGYNKYENSVFSLRKLIVHHLWLSAHSLARSFTARGIKNKPEKPQNTCSGACALRYGQKQTVLCAFLRSKGTFRLPGDAQAPGDMAGRRMNGPSFCSPEHPVSWRKPGICMMLSQETEQICSPWRWWHKPSWIFHLLSSTFSSSFCGSCLLEVPLFPASSSH